MKTDFSPEQLKDPAIQRSNEILRTCVHCGFCNATCPTYQLRGDELDGPPGRIYQMKQYFEGEAANAELLKHLDRCLTCRSCETTCPSGVEYHRLLEIGRTHVEALVERSLPDRLKRRALVETVPNPDRLEPLLKLGRLARPLLPGTLKAKLPTAATAPEWPAAVHERKVILLEGCVQSISHPGINSAAARVLVLLQHQAAAPLADDEAVAPPAQSGDE